MSERAATTMETSGFLAQTGAFTPDGPVARDIADLWWLMLAVGTAVYVLFLFLFAVGAFRSRTSREERGD
ncbi:MAG TPA: hypothetical protein VG709_07760, partial [Actinomycetota bacterium]|nr:hypothetical protein [Actinomycetota bacterium]